MRSSIAVLIIASGLAQASPVIKRDLTPQTLDGWYSYGCWTDSQSSRTLETPAHFGEHVSDTNCQYQCQHLAAGAQVWAGTEYAGQCYCSNTFNPNSTTATQRPLSECNMACTGDNTQPCGAGDRISLFGRTPPPSSFSQSSSGSSSPPPAPSNVASAGSYQYKGCYTDAIGSRILANQLTTNGAVTNENCAQAAAAAGWTIFGTEYSSQCYGGNALQNGQTYATDQTTCSMTCSGNSSEICGGAGRISIYTLNGASPTVASPPASSASAATIQSSTSLPKGWGYRGCYTDNNGKRGLNGLFVNEPAGGMTIEYCISACAASGFQIAGTEYGKECRCGNTVDNGAGLAPDGETGCSMPCSGSNEICGGPNRQSVYSTGGPNGSWISLGCYSDDRANRTLVNTLNYQGQLTTEIALATCQADAYVLCGAEYGNELYGSNYFSAGGPAPDGSAGCSFAAAGNSSEIAGGANRLSMYAFVSPDGQIHTTTPAASNSPAPAPAPAPAQPAAGPTPQTSGLPAGWSYANCYVDNTNGRIMAHQQPDSSTLTPSQCISTCQSLGYSLSGQEYASQCFCDNSLQNSAKLASSDSQCSMGCSGNSSIACGAGGFLSVYASGPVTVQAAPVPQTSGLPAGFSYAGCVADSVNARVFPVEKDMPGTANATSCLSYCQGQGYPAAGIEYANQCYCGSASQASAALQNPSSNCGMVCDGAQQYICGGPGAMTLYTSS